MKVTVKTYLNVRAGRPGVNAPCYQYLAPGSELEVDGKLYKGDPFEGSNLWYKDRTDNYYWAGGIEPPDIPDTNPIKPMSDYHRMLDFLPAPQFGSKGESTTIAMIDDGTRQNTRYLDPAYVHETDFTATDGQRSHGTFIAGILAGKNTVQGITSRARIHALKFKNMPGLPLTLATLNSALETLTKADYDKNRLIVNISQAYNYITVKDMPARTGIDEKLQTLANEGALIFAAGGDDTQLLQGKEQYPALLDCVCSVGCVSQSFIGPNLSQISGSVDILSPLAAYTSFDETFATKTSYGSSFATAMMSGLASLMLAGGLEIHQIPDELKKYPTPVSGFVYELQNRFHYLTLK